MVPTLTDLDYAALWDEALPFEAYLPTVTRQQALWEGAWRTARLPAWVSEAFAAVAPLRLLALNADWCLDSASVIPLLARLATDIPGIELRLLERDAYPEVMDRYLTDGTRSIPLVILLDSTHRPRGHWGPRPAPLQAWVQEHLPTMPKEDRLRETRRWYARDRGETILRELLALASAPRVP